MTDPTSPKPHYPPADLLGMRWMEAQLQSMPGLYFSIKHKHPFQGDSLFVEQGPQGQKYFIILSTQCSEQAALLSGILSYEAFSGMVKKGFAIEQIVDEIQQKLINYLPKEAVVKILMIVHDSEDDTFLIWHGADAPLYVYHAEHEKLVKKLGFACNINDPSFKNNAIDVLRIPSAKEHTFFYQDLNEDQGVVFEKLHALCQQGSYQAFLKQSSTVPHCRFILEPKLFTNAPVQLQGQPTDFSPLSLNVSFHLNETSLKHWDPLPAIMHVLMEPKGLRAHRTEVFTLFTELYTNALDHGVLGLDSNLKSTPQGIVEYYEKKQTQLLALKKGYINIIIDVRIEAREGRLQITVEDSGKGFEMPKENIEKKYSGRGISLITQLADDLHYDKNGAHVCVTYTWSE